MGRSQQIQKLNVSGTAFLEKRKKIKNSPNEAFVLHSWEEAPVLCQDLLDPPFPCPCSLQPGPGIRRNWDLMSCHSSHRERIPKTFQVHRWGRHKQSCEGWRTHSRTRNSGLEWPGLGTAGTPGAAEGPGHPQCRGKGAGIVNWDKGLGKSG